MYQLPIIHIDQVAEHLNLTRVWINRNWLKSDDPPPHWRNGDSVFFEVKELQEWARRKALGSGSTNMPDDPMD